jgi:hypothetical protein
VPVATLTLFYIRVSYTKVNHNSFFIRGFLHVLRRTRFFARLGARLGAPQRRDFTRRAAQRRVQCKWYVNNVFTEPTCRKCVPARANRRRTRTRIALLTVHNSSSRFLCPWHPACSASPCLPRPRKVAPCFETCYIDTLDNSAAPVRRFGIHAGAIHARNAWVLMPKLPFLTSMCKSADWKDIYRLPKVLRSSESAAKKNPRQNPRQNRDKTRDPLKFSNVDISVVDIC